MKISPARTAAFDILLRIERDRAYSSVLLPQFEADLPQIDRSLCHELVLGCLRRQIYLDRVISHFTKGKKTDTEVRIALRLALYQLYFLDRVPQYSAINESVNLVQRAKKTSAKGFVNAILRKAASATPDLSFADDLERLSVETSHPQWLLEKWITEFGFDETAKLAAANNLAANTAFRTLRDKSEEAERLIDDSRPSKYVDNCYIAFPNEHRLFDLAERGEIYIQDEASQMVAQSVKVESGGRFLDVCAAPGGKTGLVARNFQNDESLVIAGDLHLSRVKLLQENMKHQGVDFVQIVQYDAELPLPFAEESFDAVLVDAPCSGTGTIRHNPEIRYLLTENDLIELPRKQLNILKNASKLVRPGGSLIYSTCSLEIEENEAVCRQFIAGEHDFESVNPDVSEDFVTADGFAHTYPHRDEMDGFFIAQFNRKNLVP